MVAKPDEAHGRAWHTTQHSCVWMHIRQGAEFSNSNTINAAAQWLQESTHMQRLESKHMARTCQSLAEAATTSIMI